jgi:5'-3' exonuclease
MKVHVVDGTYELFRAHFGAPPAAALDGTAAGATRGLLHTLLALLASPGVTHVACAFDHVIESFRNDLFEGYKTSEGVPPELLAQFPLAERLTHALGIVVWPMVELEADDALATAATRWAEAGGVEQVVICSPDKDLAQCVKGTRVVCLDRRQRKLLDEAGVREKFGVAPRSIPDWLALVGDSADGYPGLPRWGAKSASAVLGRYLCLEGIPQFEREWDVPVRGAAALGPSRGGGALPPAGHAAHGRRPARIARRPALARRPPRRTGRRLPPDRRDRGRAPDARLASRVRAVPCGH